MDAPENLRYSKDHEWLRREDGEGVVGITAYAAEELGDVVFVELPEPGDSFAASDEAGVVESVKAASDVYAPIAGEVIEVDGLSVGFAGGGVATPLRAQGEVSDDEMESLLDGLGAVDVLCTHVPPAVPSLRRDVITGRDERGSEPILRYLKRFQPRLHLFGDVHQPQATGWRVGATRCFNAGYFRATGRYLRLDGPIVHVGRVG